MTVVGPATPRAQNRTIMRAGTRTAGTIATRPYSAIGHPAGPRSEQLHALGLRLAQQLIGQQLLIDQRPTDWLPAITFAGHH
jgi:hypothetical protein